VTRRGDTVGCGNWGGTGLNTTELIKHWTMQGATPDVGDRFRSMAGVLAVAEDDGEPPATPDALRMRGPDEEEWRPLLLAAGDK
jgi:hypothetical protein